MNVVFFLVYFFYISCIMFKGVVMDLLGPQSSQVFCHLLSPEILVYFVEKRSKKRQHGGIVVRTIKSCV